MRTKQLLPLPARVDLEVKPMNFILLCYTLLQRMQFGYPKEPIRQNDL